MDQKCSNPSLAIILHLQWIDVVMQHNISASNYHRKHFQHMMLLK